MSGKAHIVVVDDQADVRETLVEYLESQGFVLHQAGNGAELKELLGRERADLVLLDVHMPGEDGLSLARYLRERYKLGIIMISGADQVVDRIVGLEMGADDYVTKPFDLREVLARVKSVLRRAPPPDDQPTAPGKTPNQVRFGRCLLNLEARTLASLDGKKMPLTAMEFDLLKVFAENPDKILSRERLLEVAHNRGWDPFDRSIDIRINRVRRKIEFDPAKPEVLKTVRGEGYIFVSGDIAKTAETA